MPTSFDSVMPIFVEFLFFKEKKMRVEAKISNLEGVRLILEYELQSNESGPATGQFDLVEFNKKWDKNTAELNNQRQELQQCNEALNGELYQNLSCKMRHFVEKSRRDHEFPIGNCTKLLAYKMLTEKFDFKISGFINCVNDGAVEKLQELLNVHGVRKRPYGDVVSTTRRSRSPASAARAGRRRFFCRGLSTRTGRPGSDDPLHPSSSTSLPES
ncbi:hypothetical protein FNV43_RR23143 [Rhamnella rubrinervis]|uniref:Uncharacterized protein n=1 Tax=Rhamnella rubrinervis TaxID=2594499 RepID=A0A8K0DWK4_9ROSA|nr:hypothetical protein FNV43_RR23143 [Rhamnella rubrinervis]